MALDVTAEKQDVLGCRNWQVHQLQWLGFLCDLGCQILDRWPRTIHSADGKCRMDSFSIRRFWLYRRGVAIRETDTEGYGRPPSADQVTNRHDAGARAHLHPDRPIF